MAEQVAPQDVNDESWTQLTIDLDRRDRVVHPEPITEPIRRKLLQRDLGAHPFDGTARLGFERHKGDIGCSKRPCVVQARFGAEELRLIGGLTGLDVERAIDDAAPGNRRAFHIDAGEYLLTSLVDDEHHMDMPSGFINRSGRGDPYAVVAVAEVVELDGAASRLEGCRLEHRSDCDAKRADHLLGGARFRAFDVESGNGVLPAFSDLHRQLGGLPGEDRCLNLDDGFEISTQSILLRDCRLQARWFVPHRYIDALCTNGGIERGGRNRLLT